MMSQFYISDRESRSKDGVGGDIESCRNKSRYSKLEEPVKQQYSDDFDGAIDIEEEEAMLEKETKRMGRLKCSFNEPLHLVFVGSFESLLYMIGKAKLLAKSCKGQICHRRRGIKNKGLMLQVRMECRLGPECVCFDGGKYVYRSMSFFIYLDHARAPVHILASIKTYAFRS